MRKHVRAVTVAALTLAAVSFAEAGPIVRSAGGDNTGASILPTVTQFRADLGNPNNGNVAGSFPSGRREINWDGGGNAALATNFPIPMKTFNTPPLSRGAEFVTAGTGFQISGQPNPEFGNINLTYPGIFGTFSSPRLFTSLGSNVLDVLFFVPGTNLPALVAGFGAVFTDVDLASTTSLQFFDKSNASLGTFFVPDGTVDDASLSFLGVSFTEGDTVSRVRITSGNAAVGPNDGAGTDIVVMDDFIYAEPRKIPEPATWLLMVVALAGLILTRKNQA
jgi:hypothetical protein